MAPFSETLTVFRNRTFRTLWLASLTSNFGGLIQLVGAAWLMTTLSSSEGMVALVQASNTLPIMVGSFVAGVLADNFDRRKVMLVAQVFMLGVSAVQTVMALQGLLTPWLLLSLIGCGTALHQPSWHASIGDLVPRDDLPSAVAVNAMGMNITRAVGPGAGGAIVAVVGAVAAFAVNAVSYLAIIAALLVWKPDFPARRLPPEQFGGALAAGLRYVAMSPHLSQTTFRGFLFCFAAVAVQALLPLVARDQLGGTALVYGFLLGAFGFGAVCGALATVRVRKRLGNETICRIGFLGFAASSAIVAVSPVFALSAAAMFVAGGCWLNVLSLLNVSIQISTPRWVLGRMLALYMTGIFGGMAAGSWAWGALSDAYGISAALLASAATLVFGALWGLWAPTPPFNRQNLDPLNRSSRATPVLDLNERNGPIMLLVEYEIAAGDIPAFLEAMILRRRIRLRDGAALDSAPRRREPGQVDRDLSFPDLDRLHPPPGAPDARGRGGVRAAARLASRPRPDPSAPDDRAADHHRRGHAARKRARERTRGRGHGRQGAYGSVLTVFQWAIGRRSTLAPATVVAKIPSDRAFMLEPRPVPRQGDNNELLMERGVQEPIPAGTDAG